MPSQLIQWFPGHMAKTKRLIRESLSSVDLIIEVLDARVPLSSANPELMRLISGKPLLKLFSKTGLADPDKTAAWKRFYAEKGIECVFIDTISGSGYNEIMPAVRRLLAEKIERNEKKGMSGKALRAMVVGIPNSGKSSLINKLAGAKKARVEDRPGVTVSKQWVSTSIGLELLDMPGVLWPKFEDQTVGLRLAFTGAVKDDVLDLLDVASRLCGTLRETYPRCLCERYKLSEEELYADELSYDLLLRIGKKRGFLLSGGVVDDDRTARILLDEFRGGKIGRITLEKP
ncbi:MAG: ribosome biogenesis GTPase YlqF [Ruminococcaceae bacterium]|nr:ribosome biogenesis GTPase YlqF [Oscillospiraceae bacterium]